MGGIEPLGRDGVGRGLVPKCDTHLRQSVYIVEQNVFQRAERYEEKVQRLTVAVSKIYKINKAFTFYTTIVKDVKQNSTED